MVSNFARWLKANPPPDLQALVEEFGAFDLIPEHRVQQFYRDRERWSSALKVRHLDAMEARNG